ncbi:MAG: family 16 glycosylhydrolase [Gemmatimonadaceae bacterium]|nr:family 16 glycosylhydrolase [Chitinophagaceae bacterium]
MKTVLILWLPLALAAGCGKKGGGTDVVPKVIFDDVSVVEGTGASVNVEVTVKLDQKTGKAVTMTYSSVDGSARAGEDYTAVSNKTLTFQPNEIEKKFSIAVTGDDLREGDEIFAIKLENTVNAVVPKASGNITLRNDDTKVGFNNTGYDAPNNYPGYTLSWADEFNGTSLDAGAWTNELGDGCPTLCGFGNNELQYYTNPPSNLFFQDGKMLIEARQESVAGKNFTSARIKTQGKKSFQFGRIDIRALLPYGKGIWPAFWLMPQDNVFGGWPRSGEIDLMEYVGSEQSKVLGTLHFGPGPGSTYITKNYFLPTGTFHDQFHVFSLEWKTDQIKWLVDGNVYATINKADLGANNYPFNEKFYFIINMAVGGNLPGPPDANTVYPQWLIVDYIRIYQ